MMIANNIDKFSGFKCSSQSRILLSLQQHITGLMMMTMTPPRHFELEMTMMPDVFEKK